MKRKIIISILIVMVLSLVLCFSGCSIGQTTIITNNIVSIEKTASNGLVDTYTITLSDGSTSTFEITNGRDGTDGVNGKDGENIDIQKLYEDYLEVHPNTSYESFIKELLSVNVNIDGNTSSISKALQSSAKIYTEFTETYRIGRISTGKETSIYLGSAVIYSINEEYTYFITNCHVVYLSTAIEENKIAKKIVCYLYGSEGEPTSTGTKDANGCTIYDYGKYAIDCEYVGSSVSADIAVFRAKTSDVMNINENVEEIEFADGYSVGNTAIAIGNPEGEGISVTEGVVSVDNEYINLSIDGTTRSYRCLRIDTAIYSGSSGGGLFNIDGKLIGITNAGDGNDQNVNYAIPVEIVKAATENIIYYSKLGVSSAKKITLGITVSSENSKYVYDALLGTGKIVEDVVITAINSNSIGSNLGILESDIIQKMIINGNEYQINRSFNIGDKLLSIRSGDVISFIVKRGDDIVNTNEYTVKDSDLSIVA